VSSRRDMGATFVLSLPLSGGPSARNGRL